MSEARTNEGAAAAARETADVHTASADYAARFGGAVGRWMLGVQEKIALRQLVPLAERGWNVTVVGSGPDAQSDAVREANYNILRFATGDLLALPFPDRSFDVVLCFRLLTHCDRWRELAGELCRVARRAVIADYPTRQSLNCIAPALFGAKKKVEKNTRTFTLFGHREMSEAFAAHGFRRTALDKQFFLPMVLHRMLKSVPLSRLAEGTCRAVGLTAWLGSPVIARFERGGDA